MTVKSSHTETFPIKQTGNNEFSCNFAVFTETLSALAENLILRSYISLTCILRLKKGRKMYHHAFYRRADIIENM